MITFLDIPSELRQQIYSLDLQVQQLKIQNICDPAWLDAEKPAGIPSLFFVSKAVSDEATVCFYDRAILNITPLRPPAYLFDSLNGNGPVLNLAYGLDVAFASCPRRHLKRITIARVFSGQHDAINAEAYEALLRWLVDNTAVREFHLSYRLMTRLRKAKVNTAALSKLCLAAPRLSLLRTVHVYGHDARSAWELTRMAEINHALKGAKLPEFQAHVLEEGGQHDALLDPRWDLRRSSTTEEINALQDISDWIDSLVAQDDVANQPEWDRAQKAIRPGLYQLCFVFGPSKRNKT
ncbi:hypothetical protein H2200_004937 [Cladophialophora chaetospira]|uniref:Uncharacterized protein n=1 Tax=Cladophialophora chaetospira TaxID=386627 RepID=A0AA38XE18_9EURO|nr:hypothetical protein H2200_004937 [Cladophialophora chaetospira]